MKVLKIMGSVLLKGFIRIIQIPLTILYFILSFCGGLIAGLGWLFGVFVFGTTIILWIFGEFDTWYQIAVALAISTAIVALPGWITDFLGEGIMFLKMALSELSI